MAQIVVNIPNDQVGRAVDALCRVGGYDGDPEDQAARREFARGVVARFVRQTVIQAEREQATATAMASVTIDPLVVD